MCCIYRLVFLQIILSFLFCKSHRWLHHHYWFWESEISLVFMADRLISVSDWLKVERMIIMITIHIMLLDGYWGAKVLLNKEIKWMKIIMKYPSFDPTKPPWQSWNIVYKNTKCTTTENSWHCQIGIHSHMKEPY